MRPLFHQHHTGTRTNYDAAEIEEWFSGFIEDNPSGTLHKDKMLEMYRWCHAKFSE